MLSVGYDGVPVEKDLSFSVNKGDYLCIVGENGSGKTTLMKTLLGLIPPVSGKILFDTTKDDEITVNNSLHLLNEAKGSGPNKPDEAGAREEHYTGLYKGPAVGTGDAGNTDIPGQTGFYTDGAIPEEKSGDTNGTRPEDKPGNRDNKNSKTGSETGKESGKMQKPGRIKGIGYLPQQTQVQKDFPASVKEIVLSGCQSRSGLRPFYNREEKALAEANMEKMGILQLKDRSYRDLSGGQQQRVLLARALCATQNLLLLDEPVSGLDPKVTMEMYDLIRKLNEDGITIIMITHDIQVATMYASHILHLGAKRFFGTVEDYLGSNVGRFFMLRQKGGVCL